MAERIRPYSEIMRKATHPFAREGETYFQNILIYGDQTEDDVDELMQELLTKHGCRGYQYRIEDDNVIPGAEWAETPMNSHEAAVICGQYYSKPYRPDDRFSAIYIKN